MADVPITFKMRIVGADDVKARLEEINAEFRNTGDIKTFKKNMGELSGISKTLTGNLSQNKNILLAMNPGLNTVSRALSTMGRSAHAAMSVMNTLNLANLALNSSNDDVAEKTQKLAEAQKEFLDALATGDPNKIAEAQKKLGDAQKDLADATKKRTEQMTQNWITFGATAIFTASTVGNTLIELAAKFPMLAGKIGAMGVPLGIVAIGIAALAVVSQIEQYLFPALQGIFDQVGKDLGGKTVFTDILTAILLIPIAIGKILDPSIYDWNTFKDAWFKMMGDIYDGWTDIANILIDVNNLVIQYQNWTMGLNRPLEEHLKKWKEIKKEQEQAATSQFGNPFPWEPMPDFSKKPKTPQYDIWGGLTKFTPDQPPLSNNPQLNPLLPMDPNKKINDFQQQLIDHGVYGNTQQGNQEPVPVILQNPNQQQNDFTTEANIIASGIKPITNTNKSLIENTTQLNDSTETISLSTETQKEQIKTAKQIASENARIHHEQEMTALALKQATFDNTDALYHLALINGSIKPPSAGGSRAPDTSQEGHNVTASLHGGNPAPEPDRGHNASNDIPGNRNQETGAAAMGFHGIVSAPTNMLMGENGPEMVSITPLRSGKQGGGGSIVINNYISGSVLSSDELGNVIDRKLKSTLKQVGFD